LKTLYLLRHAKAESATVKEDDINRKLSARGREACTTIGIYMKTKGYAPSLVLCSPATRTRETLEYVMESACISPPHTFEKSIYLATIDKIIDILHCFDDGVDSLMIVGHNPAMHHLALTLAQPESTGLHALLELKYPTGALTVLRFPVNSWQDIMRGEGELLDFMTPSAF